jgi:hypothetical protein
VICRRSSHAAAARLLRSVESVVVSADWLYGWRAARAAGGGGGGAAARAGGGGAGIQL